ncbi:MAG: hypothetical protein SF066_01720 [Thermoanaerobaculia bacterium]|nr:hypothetical protein [Thermoanaerobaculia bacterium]
MHLQQHRGQIRKLEPLVASRERRKDRLHDYARNLSGRIVELNDRS